jgi:hypothetical protein
MSNPSTKAIPAGFAHEPPRLVTWLAFIGALFVALEIYVFGAWILSPDFRPSPLGADPIPGVTMFWVRFFEGFSILAAPLVVWWCWRTCKRDGRLSLEAIIAIAWATLFWQDPIYNWNRPNFFYNANFFNYGNWTEQIPGWINPTGSLLPEPLLFMGLAYIWMPIVITLLTVALMNRVKARWPSLSVMQMIGVGMGFCMLLDFVIEVIWVRMGLYAYPNTLHALSINGGKTYQFPIYESLFWGAVWASTAILYYFRDDKGRTVLDRGLDRVKAVRWHGALRVLAMAAFLNISFGLYNTVMIWISFQGDATPAGYASWLKAGMCGQGTDYACHAPDMPVPLPDSGPLPPPAGRD